MYLNMHNFSHVSCAINERTHGGDRYRGGTGMREEPQESVWVGSRGQSSGKRALGRAARAKFLRWAHQSPSLRPYLPRPLEKNLHRVGGGCYISRGIEGGGLGAWGCGQREGAELGQVEAWAGPGGSHLLAARAVLSPLFREPWGLVL